MLLVLTMFAITGFNLSSVNLKIAGNYQQHKYMEAIASQAIEQAISNVSTFTAPAAQSITIDGIVIPVTIATCYHYTVAKGYEINLPAATPEDDIWELSAVAVDPQFGAKATVTQGVRLRMLPNNCV
jgi:Tfp pilus assembly protein PilX